MAEILPPLYQAWVEQLLPSPLRAESRATCASCPMVAEPAEGFHASVKCCTFYPELSNFLVGRVLDDESAARGREVLSQRIAARIEVTPLGIWQLPVYQAVYQQSVLAVPGTFGRAPALRCPFYIEDGGSCGIWRHRNAICATWFCKYERGARGAVFWQLLKELLRELESSLRTWCVMQLDLGADAVRALWITEGNRGRKPIMLDANALAGAPDPAKYARMWGNYLGREAELYRQCAAMVAELSFERALEIAGAEAQLAAKITRELFERMETEAPLPSHVIPNPAVLVQLGRRPGQTRVRNTTVPHDPLDLPTAIVEALPRLAGEPLRKNVEKLRAEGIDVDDALLRKLIDYEVLLPS